MRPCAGADCGSLPLQLCTLAELLRAAGHFELIAPETSARDHEIALESRFLDFDLSRYTIVREPADYIWSFFVSEPVDAEEVDAS